MSGYLPLRIPEEDLKYLEEKAKREKIPKAVLARKLLHEKILEEKFNEAVQKYLKGEISLGKAAENANLSIREFIARLASLGIVIQYSKESLEADLEAAKRWARKQKRK